MAEVATRAEQTTSEQRTALQQLTDVSPSANASLRTAQLPQKGIGCVADTSSNWATGQPAAAGSTTAAISGTAVNTRHAAATDTLAAQEDEHLVCMDVISYSAAQQQLLGINAPAAAAEHGGVASAAVEDASRCATSSSAPAKKVSVKSSKGLKNGKKGGKGHMVCKVDGCGAVLSSSKAYYQRHRVCAVHLGAMAACVDGVDSRFCQQCGKFQPLEEFDNDKRSCRSRLKRHNSRRREQRHSKGMEFAMLAVNTAGQTSDSGGVMPGSSGPGGADADATGCGEHHEGKLAAAQVLTRALNPNASPNPNADDTCNAGTRYEASPLLLLGSLAEVPQRRTQMRRSSAARALEAMRTINAASSHSTSSDFEEANDSHQRSPLAVAFTADRKRVLKRPGSAGGERLDGLSQHAEGLSSAAHQRFSHPGFIGEAGPGPRCNLFNSLAAVHYNSNSGIGVAATSSTAAVHVLPRRGSGNLPIGPEALGLYDKMQGGGVSRFATQHAGGVPPSYGQQQQLPHHNDGYPNIGLPRFDDCCGWARPQRQQLWPCNGQQQQHYPAWDMPRAEQQQLQHQRSTAAPAVAAGEVHYAAPGSTGAAVGDHCAASASAAAAAGQYSVGDGMAADTRMTAALHGLLKTSDALVQDDRQDARPQSMGSHRLHSTASGTFFTGSFNHHAGRYSDVGGPAVAAAAAAVQDSRTSSFPGGWMSPVHQPHQQHQPQQTNHAFSKGNDAQLDLHYSSALQQQRHQQQLTDTSVATAAAAADVAQAADGLYSSNSTVSLHPLQLHQQQLMDAHNGIVPFPQQQQQQHAEQSAVRMLDYNQSNQDNMHLTAPKQEVSQPPMFCNTDVDRDGAFGLQPSAADAAATSTTAALAATGRGPNANTMVSPFARTPAALDQQLQQQQQQLAGGAASYNMINPGIEGSAHDRGGPRFSAAGSDTLSATGFLRSDLAGITLAPGALGSLQQQQQHSIGWTGIDQKPSRTALDMQQQQQHSTGWTGINQQNSSTILDTQQQHTGAARTCLPSVVIKPEAEVSLMTSHFSHPAYTAAPMASAVPVGTEEEPLEQSTTHPPLALTQSVAPSTEHQATASLGGSNGIPIPDSTMFNSVSADEDFGELLELLLECDEQQHQAQQQQRQQPHV